MTVYVDASRYPLTIGYRRMMMCHMVADTLEELHAMARELDIPERHFQNRRHPHYDICKAKRKMAVKRGAQEVESWEIVLKSKQLAGRG